MSVYDMQDHRRAYLTWTIRMKRDNGRLSRSTIDYVGYANYVVRQRTRCGHGGDARTLDC